MATPGAVILQEIRKLTRPEKEAVEEAWRGDGMRARRGHHRTGGSERSPDGAGHVLRLEARPGPRD